MQSCVVGVEGGPRSVGAEAQRPLTQSEEQRQHHSLTEGSRVVQHHGCMPTCRISVPQLMLGCAGGAAAALAVVRWRQRRAARF